MQITFPEKRQLLKIGVVLLAAAMGVGSWLLMMETLSVQAAPPLRPFGQEEPISSQGITHTCQIPGLAESPWNDTHDAAVSLVAGSQPQTHTLDSGGPDYGTFDKDWFYFSVPAKQVFTLSTTFPGTSVLTTTEIKLYTSATTALANNPAFSTQSGALEWVAADSPAVQTFWARVVNPYAATQTSTLTNTELFCDVVYRVKLMQAGNLDNSGTQKTAQTGPDRTLTYTIILSNTGEMITPVVVTDSFPPGVNLLQVVLSPSSVTTELLTSTTGLTWTGWAPGYTSIQFTLNTTVTQGITQLQNTTWINAGAILSRTSGQVTFPSGAEVYLPIVIKN